MAKKKKLAARTPEKTILICYVFGNMAYMLFAVVLFNERRSTQEKGRLQ